MKKLFICISLLFVLTCAKDNSEDDSSVYISPPSNTTNTVSPSTTVTQYTLTVSVGDGGSVSTSGGTYNDGTSINIVATPNEGYEFVGWIGLESTSSSITLTIGSNVTLRPYSPDSPPHWLFNSEPKS